MQPRHFTAAAAQGQETVIVDGRGPIGGQSRAIIELELAEKPAGKVDQVHALVDQLATAGKFFLATPFLFHADAAAVTIATADVHEGADRPLIHERSRL